MTVRRFTVPTAGVYWKIVDAWQSKKITEILRKTTDGNLQANRTERKFSFRSDTFGRLDSVPFHRKRIRRISCEKNDENKKLPRLKRAEVERN
uniref:Uncharacterized protein n=1 Tax=Romanomermis culicivorax TaxID=13658 RepID=A0A915K7F1_ROMCU